MSTTRCKRGDTREALRLLCARPLNVLTAIAFFFSLGAPYASAHAQSVEPVQVEVAPAASDTPASSRSASVVQQPSAVTDSNATTDPNASTDPNAPIESTDPADPSATDSSRPRTVQALPDGPAKSAVTPQAISLPKGEGSIQGMGESFTPNLSAGTGTFSVPIALPAGRAGVQPSLSLAYSTGGGSGPVGVGWGLAAPFIARQTDRGMPRYADGPLWTQAEDRFIYNGGQELVPVDSAAAAGIDTGVVPADLTGFQQYRARVEGAFMRFFRAPDGKRWVVQDKNGTRFDFGLLSVGDGPAEAISGSADSLVSEYDGGGGRIWQWNLTRMSDAHGSTVYYSYLADQGNRYLQDLYYVSPSSCAANSATVAQRRACNAPLSDYGRHVHLVYEGRDDVYSSYVSTWRIATAKRLHRIEVTSYDSVASARMLVRRYHLRYDPSRFMSLLTELQVEGRPDSVDPTTGVYVGSRVLSEGSLGESIVGRLLPPMRFTYSQARNVTTDVIPGFGGLDGTVHSSPSSPTVSVSEDRADLFDVNSDGLPDVIVTDPARYRSKDGSPAVGVFFNGFAGADAHPAVAGGFSEPIPMAIPSGQSGVLNLGNLNINPMDADGDGRSDLLHMPRLANYGYFTPVRGPDDVLSQVSPAAQNWSFAKKQVALPSGDLDPRVDFGRDGDRIKILDVNNDHLTDVVRTTGTEMQTFLNLGWLPGGNGRFGSATFDGTKWNLSTAPISSCVLELGLPVDFADPELRIADMNGDGIQDIVKLRKGRVVYWPGRGPGLWGVGGPNCGTNQGDGREVEMQSPPQEINSELADVFVSDVDNDGADDILQVRFQEIDVWFNRAGQGFTERTIIKGAPAAPGYANRIRFSDIDGSGTTDIVYGTAGHWQYIDPMGGQRPRLLIGVENGLGGLTTLEYGSSTAQYLQDLREATACNDSGCDRFTWSGVREEPDAVLGRADTLLAGPAYRSGGSPTVSTVVTAVSTSDQFSQVASGQGDFVKMTKYRYHEGYFEGIEHEFRGFGAADAIEVGDSTEPTSTTRTRFDQGRRPGELASDRLSDNPNEALKGREVQTEVFDDNGVYLSTSHASLTVRRLLTGLDGRDVSYAFVGSSDELRYDTANTAAGPGPGLAVTSVVRESATTGLTGFTQTESVPYTLRVRNANYAQLRTTIDSVDNAGNLLLQTAHGRVRGEYGEALQDESIASTSAPVLCNTGDWIWRTASQYVTGQGDSTPLGLTTSDYAPGTCDLVHTSTQANLPRNGNSPVAFDFTGERTGETLVQSDQMLESSTGFDAWGNATQSCAGGNLTVDGTTRCLRLGEVDYDSRYLQFPLTERVATDRSGGNFVFLPTSALWDEGLGVLSSVTDPNSLQTSLTYDGLGRLTSLTPPKVEEACLVATPLTRISYELVVDGLPVSQITTKTALHCNPTTLSEQVSVALVDGLGRKRVALAQAEDADNPTVSTRWQRGGMVRFTARGAVAETFQPDLIERDLTTLSLGSALALPDGSIASSFTYYDAFGRVTSSVAEDGSASRTIYHALSTDVWDANDLDASSADYGTPATERKDGHGRGIDQVLRNRQLGKSDTEYYRLFTDYRADGKVVQVTRAETNTDAARGLTTITTRDGRAHSITRQLSYDTAGRRIASTDPDTNSRVQTDTAKQTWRYLFNRVGDLAAVRDPRGCGQNFYYDHAGRLIAEHYVACGEAQQGAETALENVPANAIGLDLLPSAGPGADARYYFDQYPSWFSNTAQGMPGVTLPAGASGVLGRATGVMDRGGRSVMAYDDRGNGLWSARELGVIPSAGPAATTLSASALTLDTTDTQPGTYVTYDTAHIYTRTATFDHAARPLSMAVEPFAGTDRRVSGALSYNARGLPLSASATVSFAGNPAGLYQQSVVDRLDYTRDGLVSRTQYGPSRGGEHEGAVSETFYDVRRRPERMLTTRQPFATPQSASTQVGRPLNDVSVVVDQSLLWDRASNLLEVFDGRPAQEWPEGFRPVSYRAGHDALYRVASVELDYTHDGGQRTADDTFVKDYREEMADVEAADPMHTRPAPRVTAAPAGRPASLTYEYNWLANTVESTDDANQFYERSLGRVTSGEADDNGRPSALHLTSDLETRAPNDSFVPEGGRGGYLEVTYGDSGNAAMLTVHAQCTDADFVGGKKCYDPLLSSSARLAYLSANCVCAQEQHYQYRWDELNRLAEARRYDRTGGAGSYALAARQRYRYDAGNQRTVKQTIGVGAGADAERIALTVFGGDFERRGLVRDALVDAYVPAPAGEEDQYLVAGARMVWTAAATGAAGAPLEAAHRATIALSDVLGTSSAVLDLNSGAMVEAGTYLPTGARESWRSPDGNEVGAEPEGFTGKEADEEVGLTYFGERYLIARLGRWASPDPLAIHALGGGEVGNSYHYVSGNLLHSRDPQGLFGLAGALGGFAVGGLVSGGLELLRQAVSPGKIDGVKVAAAAAGGAAAGALIGATGGLSLIAGGGAAIARSAAAYGLAGAIGGTTTRVINKERTTAGKLAVDATTAIVGAGVAEGVAKAAPAIGAAVKRGVQALRSVDPVVNAPNAPSTGGTPTAVDSAQRAVVGPAPTSLQAVPEVQTYGPYIHHINHGGLDSIQASQELRAGTQNSSGFGDVAVRAYTSPMSKIGADAIRKPVIEFTTTVPPDGSNPGQSAVFWNRESLPITITEVKMPEGKK